jgi:hypothetical protein
MTSSSGPKWERGQSKTKGRKGARKYFRRPWLLKLLMAMAPILTKLVELAIIILKQLR